MGRDDKPVSAAPPRTMGYNIAMSGNMSWWWGTEQSGNVEAELLPEPVPGLAEGVVDLTETVEVDEHGNSRTVWVA